MRRLIILPLLIIFLAGCVAEQPVQNNKQETIQKESYKIGCQFPSFTWGTVNFPTNAPSFGAPTEYSKEDLLNGKGGLYFENLPQPLGNGWFIRFQRPGSWSQYQVKCNMGSAVGQNKNYLYCTNASASQFEIYKDEVQNVAEDGTILEPTPSQVIELSYNTPLIVFDLTKEPFNITTMPVIENICS